MNAKKYKYIFCLVYLFSFQIVFAQSGKDSTIAGKIGISIRDTIAATNIGWVAYPYAFYTPETQLAFGAGALVHFKTSSNNKLNPSKVLFAGYYTINNQFYFNIAPTLYFKKSGHLLSESLLIYAKEILEYHGTGIDRPEVENPDYTHFYFRFNTNLILKDIISESMYAGFNIDLSYNNIFDYEENVKFANSEEMVGRDGGFVSGLGLTFLWDSRNNIFYPTKNGYYKINFLFFDEIFFSDFNYYQITADFRQYFEILPDNIIATQLYFDGTQGDVPFYKLPMMGGSQRMRGYFEGSYRDKRFITFQAEYRMHLWWRLGLVGFLGVGNVANTIVKMNFAKSKYSYGFGLRFLFDKDENINLRMDVGFGKNTSGIYFGLEEAF